VSDYYENLMGVEAPAPSDSSVAAETSWSATSASGTTRTQVDAGVGARVRLMLKKFFFNLIRPLFVRDIKSGEMFLCEECRAPVLRRMVFCSHDCHNAHSERWIQRFHSHQ
jgi:hypothetical protein